MGKIICLVAGDHATRPNQPDHLSDDGFDPGYIHEYEPRMNEFEKSCRPRRGGSVSLNHVNIFQPTIGHKTSRSRDGVAVSFDPDHMPGRFDALREQIQNALRPTPEINCPTASCETLRSKSQADSCRSSSACFLSLSSSSSLYPQ